MVYIGLSDGILAEYVLPQLQNSLQILWSNAGGYVIVYVLEILILLLLLFVFSTLFTFCCITFASIIAKKAKLLAAIGIYYGASSIYSFMVQMFYIFGLDYLIYKISILDTATVVSIVAWGLFGMISFISILCALLYTLQYWMLDRKLNLS